MFRKACFLTIALFGSLALGQTDRVLRLSHTDSVLNFDQIGSMIHMISDADTSVDAAQRTVTIRGTAEQIALGEWLCSQIDKPQVSAPNNQDAVIRRYELENGESVVRMFSVRNSMDEKDFHGIGTAIQTIGDVRRVAAYSASRAILARGSPDQIAVAAWLIDVLDRPVEATAKSAEYRLPMTGDARGEVAMRALYTANAATNQDFQEIATAMRTTADIRRVFTYDRSRVILVRGTAEQVALGEWLVRQLDQPAVGIAGARGGESSGTYEYDTSDDAANIVKVVFVPRIGTVKDFQRFATQLRLTCRIRRVFTYNAPRAIALRGTVDQISIADRIVKELGDSK